MHTTHIHTPRKLIKNPSGSNKHRSSSATNKRVNQLAVSRIIAAAAETAKHPSSRHVRSYRTCSVHVHVRTYSTEAALHTSATGQESNLLLYVYVRHTTNIVWYPSVLSLSAYYTHTNIIRVLVAKNKRGYSGGKNQQKNDRHKEEIYYCCTVQPEEERKHTSSCMYGGPYDMFWFVRFSCSYICILVS